MSFHLLKPLCALGACFCYWTHGFPKTYGHVGNFPAVEMLIFKHLTHAVLKSTKTPIAVHSAPVSFGN